MDSSVIKGRRPGFSFWLPIVNSLVWLIFVAGPIARAYYILSAAPRSAGRTTFGPLEFPSDRIADFSVHFGLGSRTDVIRGLEIPAAIFDLLISRAVSWPSVWHPVRFLAEDWRAMSYPIYCLPFCWFAGYGLDKLLRKEKMRSLASTLGTLLMLLFLIVLLGLRFGLEPSDRSDGFGWIFCGLGLWAFLFASFPAALISSRLSREVPAT